MKTAIDYLEDEMSENTLRHIREIDYLEDWILEAMNRFANAKSKALLEEAAEKARLKMLEDQKPTPYEMEHFIKSLIPKDTTKD